MVCEDRIWRALTYCNQKRAIGVGRMERKWLVTLSGEFFRYVIVGGIAFVADFGTLVATRELFLREIPCGIYIATCLGFIAGLVVNYVLSLRFVFTKEKDKEKQSLQVFVLPGFGRAAVVWR